MSKDFLLLLGSGITIAAVDALIEIGAPGIIPATPSPLPPGDDLISLGISAVPAIIGKVTKKPLYSSIGEGMLLYSGPTALKDGIMRAVIPFSTIGFSAMTYCGNTTIAINIIIPNKMMPAAFDKSIAK